MTRRCILHVGMHKTGSTSIQYSLYKNPTLRGATYLDIGLPNASGFMMQGFGQWRLNGSPLRQAPTEEWLANRRQQCRRQLGRLLDRAQPLSLFSGEDGCRLEPAEAAEMIDLMRAHVDEVQVLAYVREARGYMESLFQQHLKGGGRGQLHLGPQYPRYRQALAKFDRLVGAEQVQLVPFKSALFPQGCVVRDFCQRVGVTIDPATIKRANEGMSRNAAGLLQNYRLLLGADPGWASGYAPRERMPLRVDRYLVSWFMQVPGSKLRFSPELLRPLFDEKREDLDWIAERLGQDMSVLGEPGPDDITSNDDLLSLRPHALDWLAQRTGVALPVRAQGEQLRPAFVALRQQAIDQVLAEGPDAPPIKVSALPT